VAQLYSRQKTAFFKSKFSHGVSEVFCLDLPMNAFNPTKTTADLSSSQAHAADLDWETELAIERLETEGPTHEPPNVNEGEPTSDDAKRPSAREVERGSRRAVVTQ
jgi:hypothetical protein